MQKAFISFILFITATFTGISARIIETKDISEVYSSIEPDTLVLFDVDDTIMTAMTHLSSDAWIKFFWATAQKHIPGNQELIDELLWFGTERVPVVPVDPNTPTLISDLQEMDGVFTFAYTARSAGPDQGPERTITHKQLNTIGIDFAQKGSPSNFHDHPSFQHGIIFSSGQLKGPHLEEILQVIGHRPSKVVFVDDKYKQIISVNESLEAMDIACDCYWYRRAEGKHPDFDPIVAAIQFESLIRHGLFISDEEAHGMKHNYSDIEVEQFLVELIDLYTLIHKSNVEEAQVSLTEEELAVQG